MPSISVDVPGCEPYREYIYIYLKEQPIWHSLRFWNAAFFDALNCERNNRPVPPTHMKKFTSLPSSENDFTASSCSSDEPSHNILEITEDRQYQQNISFGQLGSFTCNMHAFGLNRDLCNEFLRKQCIIANLNKGKEGGNTQWFYYIGTKKSFPYQIKYRCCGIMWIECIGKRILGEIDSPSTQFLSLLYFSSQGYLSQKENEFLNLYFFCNYCDIFNHLWL